MPSKAHYPIIFKESLMSVATLQRSPVAHPDRFFIDGQWVAPSSSATIDVINPTTEEVFLTVAEAQNADIDRAVDAARRAFDKGPWPRMTPTERAHYLRAIAQEISARMGDIGDVWTSQMGGLRAQADGMVHHAAFNYNFYADLADSFAFEEVRPSMNPGKTGMLVREPVGVVAAIIPWNGPVALTSNKVAPALLAGCTIVVKLSPEAPGEGLILAEICEKVGLPAGVVNVLTSDRAASEHLVRNPAVDKVSFTGSSAAGKTIASICGERIARYTLELGGKSAAVILDDYDLGAAAKALAQQSVNLTGQVCASLTRIVVPRHRHDELVEAMAATYSAIRVGDPFAEGTEMGPLAMRRQRDRVESYIEQGRQAGARIAAGGGRPAHLNRGFFVEPTVFADVSNDMVIAREEIFGPVASVIPADDEQHAIDIANDTVFGLNAAVFTHDNDRAYWVARQLRSGSVGHNGFFLDPAIAFGGFKQSGIGREGGVEGLYPYLETKTLILDGAPSNSK
jgi:betaine-aldehyde dehydrogenase